MITATQFRKELKKIMPGYKWTIHRLYGNSKLTATGIQTSGLNRLSTLEVAVFKTAKGEIGYKSKSSCTRKNAAWLSEQEGQTLVQSLRNLQNHYKCVGGNYLRHAADLQGARTNKPSYRENYNFHR